MNGMPSALHIGKTVKDLLPDVHDIDGVSAMLQDILDTGEARRNIEIFGSTPAAPNETRYWREHFFPIRSGDEVKGLAAIAEDVTEQRRAQETIKALVGELNHRSKNLLTLILAICRQTARAHPETFLKVFQARLESMSAAQDLLVQGNLGDIGIEALIRSQIPHFSDLIGNRIQLHGDANAVLPPNAAQPLALALHELTTNAAKYGALSVDEGRLAVSWSWELVEGTHVLEMSWIESDGPEVTPPAHKGFGSTLTNDMLQSSLGADVTVDYAPSGLSWRMKCALGND